VRRLLSPCQAQVLAHLQVGAAACKTELHYSAAHMYSPLIIW